MCGSSSTTTTVPLSAPTFLAFHLLHPELPESGIPLQNHDDCRTPCSSAVRTIACTGTRTTGARTRGVLMPHARSRLTRLGAIALASGATLGAVAGTAGAAAAGCLGQQRRQRGPDDPGRHQGQGGHGHHRSGQRPERGHRQGQRGQGARREPGHPGVVPRDGHRAAAAAEPDDSGGQHAAAGGPRLRDDLQRLPRLQAGPARRPRRRRGGPRHDLGRPEPHDGCGQGAGPGEPRQPGHVGAPRQRSRQPDQHRGQRDQRARRHGAGLHARAVERRQRRC